MVIPNRSLKTWNNRFFELKPHCSVVFANENFFAVHTKDGGEIAIVLPRRFSRVTDSLTGEIVAENVDRFTCRFAAPDTRLFNLE